MLPQACPDTSLTLPPSQQGILLPHEIEGVLRASHRPNYVLQARAGRGRGWRSLAVQHTAHTHRLL